MWQLAKAEWGYNRWPLMLHQLLGLCGVIFVVVWSDHYEVDLSASARMAQLMPLLLSIGIIPGLGTMVVRHDREEKGKRLVLLAPLPLSRARLAQARVTISLSLCLPVLLFLFFTGITWPLWLGLAGLAMTRF